MAPAAQRLALVALLLCVWANASAQSTPDVALVPKQVSAHGWFFEGESGMASVANRGFMSNAGFVVTNDGVVVFDALGTPELGRAMIAAIARVTPKPIRRVVVSHYHADHIYGLQALKAAGATIWAHRKAQAYLASPQAAERLAQRRNDLFPWVDNDTVVVAPDVWLDGDTDFRMGGLTFRILYSRGAHSPEDVMMYVVEDRLLFAGDLVFAGRIPYVGNADSAGWLTSMDAMIALSPAVVIPGHGPASRDIARDFRLTREYLAYLRKTMGEAARDLTPFEDAYARTDWSKFRGMPAFEQANRTNAYGTYLLMEQEFLQGGKR
jgi:glyoxylase-like metal-dependent hydrolase (beta-lactamase superfamily II)